MRPPFRRASLTGSRAAPSLRRNFSSSLVGNASYALCQFGMLCAMTRLSTPAQVGGYALAFAIAGPVFVLVGMKLRQIQATDAVGDFPFGTYLGLRIAATAVAAAALLGAVAAGLAPTGTGPLLAAVVALKTVEGVLDAFHGALQRHERNGLIARSMLVRGVAGLVVFVAALSATGRPEAGVAAVAVVAAARMVADVRRVAELGITVRPRLHRPALWRLLRIAAPLGVATLMSSLAVNVPRYFLQATGSAAALGVFAALAYLLVAGGTVVASLGEVISPRLANYHAQGRAGDFRRLLRRAVWCAGGLGAVGVAAAATAGEPFLRMLYGPPYAGHGQVLVVLMAAAAVGYVGVFFGTALLGARRYGAQLPVNIVTVTVIAGVCAWVVPTMGALGAAVAVLVGHAAQTAQYAVLYLLMRPVLPATGDAAAPTLTATALPAPATGARSRR